MTTLMSLKQAKRFLSILLKHFGRRRDFYHIVTGPKRETWFNAEAIAALARASSDNLSHDLVFTGENNYRTVLQATKSSLSMICNGDLSKKPDIVGYSPKMNLIALVVECKLIEKKNEYQVARDLRILRSQLERAKRVVPSAIVVGLVFGVHHIGMPAQPETFYKWLTNRIETELPRSSFLPLIGQETIVLVPGLQHIQPLSGKYNGEVSLGICALVAT